MLGKGETKVSTKAVERPVLYYPYIHVRPEDEPWLKATLLLHPSVVRMVPPDYPTEDAENLLPYISKEGSAGPLLDEISTSYNTAQAAKERLFKHAKDHLDYLKLHYTKEHTSQETKIQQTKFISDLLELLKANDLAWKTTGEGRYGKRDWCGLHPTLGNAIMSTIAVNIASDKGWHIITPNPALHEDLLGTTEEEIFRRLTNAAHPPKSGLTQQTANELGELVLMTSINLEKLRVEDIVELQSEKQDLRGFRDMLVERVQRIGDINDPEARAKALVALNEEVQSAWADYKAAVPARIAKTLFDATNIKPPELAGTLLSGAAGKYLISSGLGLAVIFLTYAGVQLVKDHKEREKSPYKYLSTIEKKANEYETLSTSPLGLTRDEATDRRR
jgi:hypothetical protein